MDIMSLINTQLSSINSNSQKSGDEKISSVKKIEDTTQYKKIAEEMESLFAYQLLKTMRETAHTLTEDTKSSGHDTYMSMFDIEISKLFAKRGMGLQDSIINWLERMPVSASAYNNNIKND